MLKIKTEQHKILGICNKHFFDLFFPYALSDNRLITPKQQLYIFDSTTFPFISYIIYGCLFLWLVRSKSKFDQPSFTSAGLQVHQFSHYLLLFQIFCMTLEDHKWLKLVVTNFRKVLLLSIKTWARRIQNSPKIRFF